MLVLNKIWKRISPTNREVELKNRLTRMLEGMPDTYYLATIVKPYVTIDPVLDELYFYLENPNINVRTSLINNIARECNINARLSELIEHLLSRFIY